MIATKNSQETSRQLQVISVHTTQIGPLVETSTELDYQVSNPKPTDLDLRFHLQHPAALTGVEIYGSNHWITLQPLSHQQALKREKLAKNRGAEMATFLEPSAVAMGHAMSWGAGTEQMLRILNWPAGSDLRVRIRSATVLIPAEFYTSERDAKTLLPFPNIIYDRNDQTPFHWQVSFPSGEPVSKRLGLYEVDLKEPASAIEQIAPDKRTYVAGLIKSTGRYFSDMRSITIKGAYYEPASPNNATTDTSLKPAQGGIDVTKIVSALVAKHIYSIKVSGDLFGVKPTTGSKQLRVIWIQDNFGDASATTRQNGTLSLIDDNWCLLPQVPRLKGYHVERLSNEIAWFSGWLAKPGALRANVDGTDIPLTVHSVQKGVDVQRLWAEALVTDRQERTNLGFSLRYGVLNDATALQATLPPKNR